MALNRKYLSAGVWFLAFLVSSPAIPAVLSNIIVDQFGYKTADPKIVIFAQPNTGIGSPSGFNLGAGATFQVINASGGATVFTGNAVTWNGGATDNTFSGDKVWQGTFTSLSAPGTYYVQVPNGSNPGGTSYNFKIQDNVYNGVVTASQRMFFYQRCGGNISAANGGANWNHTACHEGATQDLAAHLWNANADQGAGTARDVHGGWHDAGDYGKYITFAHASMWYLFHSAEWYPLGYPDNTNIPESGNGVPDMLDEIKYELDWMLRMQRASDGALYSMVGFNNITGSNNQGNPANDTAPRFYLNVSTTATATGAMAFALGARLFAPYGAAYPGYSAAVSAAAVSAWNYLQANVAPVTFDSTGVSSANANQGSGWDGEARLAAAAELFALTGSATYRTYFDSNYNSASVTDNGGFLPVHNPPLGSDHFDPTLSEPLQLAMVSYCLAPGATAAVTTAIKNSLKNECDNYIMNQQGNDPYLGYMYPGHYTWGSNQIKASWGNQLLFAAKLNVNPANTAAYLNQAEEYLHYFHGRNPLNWVYLTNMGTKGANLGASKPIMSIFHSWFWQGTTFDGNTGAGAIGPAPGILSGGPDQNYPSDPAYSGPYYSPPRGEPPMKSYKDWGNTWPDDSWEVTEPDQGYQAKYQFLLSAFAVSNAPTPTFTPTPTGTLPTATFTPTLTPSFTNTFSPTLTPTTCTQLFNACDTLTDNGNWTGGHSSRTIGTANHTQGSNALQVAVTQVAASTGWNDDILLLDSFAPAVWTNVVQLKMDVNLSASLVGATYSQLFLYGSSNAAVTYYQPIAAGVPLVSGQNNNVTFTINFSLGGIPPGAALSSLIFILNSDSATGLGSLSADNIRLITSCAVTPTFTPTPTATNSPTRTPTHTPTLSPTNTPTTSSTNSPTKTATNSPTLTLTSSPTVTPTNSPTASATASPTNSPTITPTLSFTPTGTLTPSNSPTPTNSPTNSPTLTSTSTATNSPSNSPTQTPTRTATNTLTATPSSTPTGTPTLTPTNTGAPTNTWTFTPTFTHTWTVTPSPTSSFTFTPSPTGTSTFTPTITPSPTGTPGFSFTLYQGATPGPTSQVNFDPATGPLQAALYLNPAPADVTLKILDTGLNTLKTHVFVAVPQNVSLSETFQDQNGNPLTPGCYLIQLSSTDGSGQQVIEVLGTGAPASCSLADFFTPTPKATEGTSPVIYPNPADGTQPVSLHVPGLTGPTDIKVQVFTTAFRKVQEKIYPQQPTGKDIVLNLTDSWNSPLASGLYYLVVRVNGQRFVTKLLVLR